MNRAEAKIETGCSCRFGWAGSSQNFRWEEFCCNPDSDPGGNWCIVTDEECKGSQWGYSASTISVAAARARACSPDQGTGYVQLKASPLDAGILHMDLVHDLAWSWASQVILRRVVGDDVLSIHALGDAVSHAMRHAYLGRTPKPIYFMGRFVHIER